MISSKSDETKSSKSEKSYHKFKPTTSTEKLFVRISDLVVPFSDFTKKRHTNDIYSGKEKINFAERHSEFRTILRQEFSKTIKEFGKNI